jgi:hypothetical protein
MKSSREVIICGLFEMVKTVEPWEENVEATVWSRPFIMVTTAMTAETPTTIPTRVKLVRSLLARRLVSATRKDSQTEAIRIKMAASLKLPVASSNHAPPVHHFSLATHPETI